MPDFLPLKKKPNLSRILLWALFATWLVGLTILSSLPGSDFAPMPFFAADKVVHFVLFAGGVFPLVFALLQSCRWPTLLVAIFAWGIMLFIAVGDEIHQRFTPGRSGTDLGDMTADAIGAAFGITCALLLYYGWRPFRTHFPASNRDRAA